MEINEIKKQILELISEFKVEEKTAELELDVLNKIKIMCSQNNYQNHDQLTDFFYCYYIKRSKRFFIDKSNSHFSEDTISLKWSPKFYKIYREKYLLANLFNNKSVLDPFAGSGLMSYYLLASGITTKLSLNDQAYIGGKPISKDFFYAPKKNLESLIKDSHGIIPNKINEITFYNKNFLDLNKIQKHNYIFTDPPLSLNLKTEHNFKDLSIIIPYLMDLVTDGLVLLLPIETAIDIKSKIKIFETYMTLDLSNGYSNHPMCLLVILNNKKEA